MSKEKWKCVNCGVSFRRYRTQVSNPRAVFCSRQCQNKWQACRHCGSSNPNFGKRRTDEWKRRNRRIIRKAMDNEEVRWRCGAANRGKKFSKRRCENISKGHIGLPHRPHSEHTKRIIGAKSSSKFTPEYKARQRKTFERLGYWLPVEDKTDWQLYFSAAQWIERMFDRCSLREKALLNDVGVFNPHTNSKGVVRDHKYSRKSGFRNGVFPEILRHPCNCQIITHAANVAKKAGRYIDADNITLKQLFLSITQYGGAWREQQQCLKLIERYENGERWKREEVPCVSE